MSDRPRVSDDADRPEIRLARRVAVLYGEVSQLRKALCRIALDSAAGLSNPRPEVVRYSLESISETVRVALADSYNQDTGHR